MSFTELRYSAPAGTVEFQVRVFANDFSAAAARRGGPRLRADSLIDTPRALAYLAANIQMIDPRGHAIQLASCGVVKAQDMLRFCFRTQAVGAYEGLRIRNTIMTELFPDQVNVVQSISAQRRASRLFVRGDGWKPLP